MCWTRTVSFEKRCNLSMVELEPVPAEDDALEVIDHQGGELESHGLVDVMRNMTGDDERRLRALIKRHFHHTASARAEHILDNWKTYLPRFVKVMPVDYRMALEAMQKTRPQATASYKPNS